MLSRPHARVLPLATVLQQPLEHLEVSGLSCGYTGFLVTRAAVRHRDLEHAEIVMLSRPHARVLPLATVLQQPLEHLEITVLSCPRTHHLVALTAVRTRPLEHLEVPALRRTRTREIVPRAAVDARPLQHLEVPALRCGLTRGLVPLTPVRTQPLEQLEVYCHGSRIASRCVQRAAGHDQGTGGDLLVTFFNVLELMLNK